jgi:hypothetical protein
MRTIPLTRNMVVVVSNADYNYLSQFKWHSHKKGNYYYATRYVSLGNGKSCLQTMHRLLTNPANGQEVDHKNGDTLNNCRSNLRLCNRSQNSANRKKLSNKTSSYKGVCLKKGCRIKKWLSQIEVNGKNLILGYFENEVDAAKSYDKAARKYFGEFARTNFIAHANKNTEPR